MKNINLDLHIHSTHSDGQYTPKEIIDLSVKKNLKIISITDHDSIGGIKEGLEYSKDLDITLIPGIELGAKEGDRIHILGYGIDFKDKPLRDLCDFLVEARNTRKFRIITYLKQKNIDITIEEVENMAKGNVIARPHFARVLVEKGYVKDSKEAFDKYLATEEFALIERVKPPIHECIQVIKKAKGLAVLAHPMTLKMDTDITLLDGFVKDLKDKGLDGIECYYSLHTDMQTRMYLDLANKYDLIYTAGSDFHGEKVKKAIELGGFKLEQTSMKF